MPARTPEEVDRLLGQAISTGDMDAALALYEPKAAFVPEPGKVLIGLDAIRQVMSSFMALKPTKVTIDAKAVQAGDIALLYSNWSLEGTGPDGKPVRMSGQGREVVRRQTDGTWRFVIDDPNGGG